MNPRERQLATIRHEVPDRISVDAIAIENCAEIAEFLHIDEGGVIEALGLDGRVISPLYVGTLLDPISGVQLTQWGTADGGDYGAVRTNPHPLVNAQRVARVEGHSWPDASQYDYEEAAQAARAFSKEYEVGPILWTTDRPK